MATSLSMLKSLSSEARCCSPLRRSCRPVYFSASSFCFFMLLRSDCTDFFFCTM